MVRPVYPSLRLCSLVLVAGVFASCGRSSGSGGQPPAGHLWDVTLAPPPLANPETITLPGAYLGTIEHELCRGPGYVVNLDDARDYVVRAEQVLTAPVRILGGRNVRIIGLHIDLATAPCRDVGASGYVPGTIALRVDQTGTTFVEGAYIDLAGRSADCIDPRNRTGGMEALQKGSSEAAARGQRDVVVQNSVCRGMSGDAKVHGDVLQTQGQYELFRSIQLENVSVDSNCEGTVIEPRDGYLLAEQIALRRLDYRADARFTPNVVNGTRYDGGPVQHSARSYAYDQVYLSRDEPPYELAPTTGPWVGDTVYRAGDTVVWAGGNVYACTAAGKSAATGGPTGDDEDADVIDGQAHWKYLRPEAYARTRPPCNVGGVFCPASPVPDRFASPGTGPATSAWTGLAYASPHPQTY